MKLITTTNKPLFKKITAALSIILLYLFHLNQNLYFVNTLNDFNEYVMRSEAWLYDKFAWGGTGKLLSIIEYLILKINDFDFLTFYHFTNILLVSIAFLSVSIFIFRKNEYLPSIEIKTLITLFLFTMPYIIFKNNTIDQSMLFTSLLLLFFAIYDIPYLGWLSFIIYISRPEGIILFPLFIIMWLLHKEKRQAILIHFFTFLLFFIAIKVFEAYTLGDAFSQQQFGKLSSAPDKVGYLSIFWFGIKKLPLLVFNIFWYGLELTQSYLIWSIFIIGLSSGLKNKKLHLFYVFSLLYLFIYMFMNLSNNPDYSDYFMKFGWLWHHCSFLPNNIFIANGYQPKYDIILHHSRYRLPLYIMVATFVVQGFYQISIWLAKYIAPLFTKKEQKAIKVKNKKKIQTKYQIVKKQIFSEQQVSYALLSIFMILAISYNLKVYSKFKIPYKFDVQWAKTEPIYKLAAEIRKDHKINDKIFIEAYCENSDGQFPTMIATYSGVYDIMLRLCNKASMRVKNHPEGKKRISYNDIKNLGTFGFIIVHSTVIDYKKSFSPIVINNLKELYKSNALDSIGIRYIISQRRLDSIFPNLELKKAEGKLNLFEYQKTKK